MNLFNIENAKKMTAPLRVEPESVRALPDAQQKIQDAVNKGSWGCQDRSVRALVKAITGVDCSKTQEGRPHVQGSVIVYNDESLLVTRVDFDGDAMFVTREGYTSTDRGDGTSYIGQVGWRAATDEEIDAFFA